MFHKPTCRKVESTTSRQKTGSKSGSPNASITGESNFRNRLPLHRRRCTRLLLIANEAERERHVESAVLTMREIASGKGAK